MKAVIQNTGKELVGNLMVADSIFSRMKGLLGKNSLQEGSALWLVPCKGVHTFGMKFPIDVIVIDRGKRIIAIVDNLKPNRISAIYPSAATIMELPAGTASAAKLSIGDIIEVTEENNMSQMPSSPLFTNPRINILLLIDITIIVYLSVFVSGFSSLDDTGLMESLQKGELTFHSVTQSAGTTYLRPLTMLTYLMDFRLWGANPSAFHGTNVLIHILNVCLVYFLCRILYTKSPRREEISLIAALFFSVTPLNSESVVWVSGRTDLLCAFFFLVAIIVLAAERLSTLVATCGLFAAFSCSLLSKESSIALLVIVPIYLLFYPSQKSFKAKLILSCTTILSALLYFILRAGGHAKLDSGTSKIVANVSDQSFLLLIYKSIAAFGFYIKKLIWPFPLNLAIQNINEPLYLVVGICAIIITSAIFIRYSALRLPLLIIVFCIAPPILALHGNIPWTLYAERYLYISMIGIAIMSGFLISKLHHVHQVIPFFLIIPLALTTIHRSGQWADPVTLWHDTVRKSPQFPYGYVMYAYELIQVGRFPDAEANINKARSMKFENELLRNCEFTITNFRQEEKKYRANKDTALQ